MRVPQFISDVYDVGLGIVWMLMLLLMAFYVNSYREALTIAPTNPPKGGAVEFVNPTQEGLGME